MVLEHAGQFVDAVQTTAIVVSLLAFIWIANLLRIAAQNLVRDMRTVLDRQVELERRLKALENNHGPASGRDALGDAIARAWERILKIEARLEALEKGEPPPTGSRPTDPPFHSQAAGDRSQGHS
jgi:hypothetical protein